jgi:putative holliday junction resolvase
VRVLGVDTGSKRIGLSVSDEERMLATPLRTIERSGGLDKAIADVAAEVRRHEVEQVVVGLPLSLDGHEGPAAKRARIFGEELEKATGVPVEFWDERFTTAAAAHALGAMSARRARRVVDQAAATILLQSYLDRKRP